MKLSANRSEPRRRNKEMIKKKRPKKIQMKRRKTQLLSHQRHRNLPRVHLSPHQINLLKALQVKEAPQSSRESAHQALSQLLISFLKAKWKISYPNTLVLKSVERATICSSVLMFCLLWKRLLDKFTKILIKCKSNCWIRWTRGMPRWSIWKVQLSHTPQEWPSLTSTSDAVPPRSAGSLSGTSTRRTLKTSQSRSSGSGPSTTITISAITNLRSSIEFRPANKWNSTWSEINQVINF